MNLNPHHAGTLKTNIKVGINFHDKANDMADEERAIIMSAWHKHFHAKIVEVETSPELFYNADQAGLYYQNLPNCVYIDEINKKDYAGLKKI